MPVAGGIIGGVAGAVGAGASQAAANKGVRPINAGLNAQAVAGGSKVLGSGIDQLLQLISTGNPVDTTQMTQTLSAQQNLQTSQNLAQLREQFGSAGLTMSSPAAVGTSNLLSNTTANFMNTLAQLQYQSSTDAANRQLGATEFGLSSFLGPAFSYQGPKGSILGAALGGGASGASSGAQTGSSISTSMQLLSLLASLGA